MASSLDTELAADVGQLFIVGFDGAPRTAPDPIRRALEEQRIGGVILFSRNVDSIDQICALNASLHAACADHDTPPFIAVDQEGGRVQRLRSPLTPIPTMRSLGAALDLRDVARVSQVQAEEIGTLGFNLNFAPVLDVDTNPDNPVIGDRSFSSDPERVARCGAGFLVGHHTAGVVPCGKHFPGHGDTVTDSHLELPRLPHDRERLETVELYPFERAVAADIPMIMTAHIEIPAIDPAYPATLSAPILRGLLRTQLGFDGVIITDCLEMKAVADNFEIVEMVDRGLEASVDIFLICHTEEKWKTAFEHLYEQASKDEEVRRRVQESAARIRRLKRDLLGHWPHPWTPPEDPEKWLGTPQHRAVVEPYLDGEGANDDDPTRPQISRND